MRFWVQLPGSTPRLPSADTGCRGPRGSAPPPGPVSAPPPHLSRALTAAPGRAPSTARRAASRVRPPLAPGLVALGRSCSARGSREAPEFGSAHGRRERCLWAPCACREQLASAAARPERRSPRSGTPPRPTGEGLELPCTHTGAASPGRDGQVAGDLSPQTYSHPRAHQGTVSETTQEATAGLQPRAPRPHPGHSCPSVREPGRLSVLGSPAPGPQPPAPSRALAGSPWPVIGSLRQAQHTSVADSALGAKLRGALPVPAPSLMD